MHKGSLSTVMALLQKFKEERILHSLEHISQACVPNDLNEVLDLGFKFRKLFLFDRKNTCETSLYRFPANSF